jgi:hypothetical protein
MERDWEKYPYTKDEQKVCDYLQEICPDVGCGSDPINFLIASHASLRYQLSVMRGARTKLKKEEE